MSFAKRGAGGGELTKRSIAHLEQWASTSQAVFAGERGEVPQLGE